MPRRELDEWLWQLGEELKLLNEETRPARTAAARRFWQPKVDVFEDRSGNIVVRSELAGVHAEDVQLAYIADSNCILIRGVRRDEDITSEARVCCHQLEILFGEFERAIDLPYRDVDRNAIRAFFKNGYLTILLRRTPNTTVSSPSHGKIVITRRTGSRRTS